MIILAIFWFYFFQPATLHVGGGVGPGNPGNMPNGPQMGPMGPPDMGTPQKDIKFQMGMGNMMVSFLMD